MPLGSSPVLTTTSADRRGVPGGPGRAPHLRRHRRAQRGTAPRAPPPPARLRHPPGAPRRPVHPVDHLAVIGCSRTITVQPSHVRPQKSPSATEPAGEGSRTPPMLSVPSSQRRGIGRPASAVASRMTIEATVVRSRPVRPRRRSAGRGSPLSPDLLHRPGGIQGWARWPRRNVLRGRSRR